MTGLLTFVEAKVDGVAGVDGLLGAGDVEISPDGAHVYVAGTSEAEVAVFSRDAGTGALTFVAATPVVASPYDLALSPDGRHLYLSPSAGGAYGAYARDSASGQLTHVNTVNAPGVIANIAVSPDGRHVYSAGASFLTLLAGLVAFDRDPVTGALELLPFSILTALGGSFAGGLAFSPDGNHLYMATPPPNTLTVFSRNTSDGSLTELQTMGGTPGNVAVSPGDGHVYFGSAGINIYQVSGPLLEAFDTGTADLRPGLGIRAGSVAVAGQHAAVLTSEEDGTAATDLNGDGEFNDQVAQLYDRQSDTVTPLGLAANRVALSNQLVAMTVPERSQGNAVRNNDGDTADDVLAIQTVPLGGPPAPVNLNVAADAIAANGATVVFTTPESAEGPSGLHCTATAPPGGCDLNGDGDSDDRVLRRYASGAVRQIRYAAEDFVTAGSLTAFRTSEAAQSNAAPPACSLNGDDDCDDAVMFVHDATTNVVVPTGQAAIPCTLPGCDPFQPYKVQGDLVSFVTREIDQGPGGIGCRETEPPGGCDLDGDGTDEDTVMQVFNVRTRRLTVVDLGEECETTQITRFVTTYIDGTIVYVRKSESELGLDVNGDGFQDDCVDLLMSDVDEDGTFEDEDVCESTQDPDQQDSDGDGIGNLCDANAFCSAFVPPAPTAAPGDSVPCQKALGKAAAAYLKKRAIAERKCLDEVAKGNLAGDASVLCRGTFVSDGSEVPPSDPKTAANILKAETKFGEKVARGCTDGDLAPLDACADTVGGLSACVLPAYGASASAATEEAYGAGGLVEDTDLRRCQSAAGNAGAKYLATVTKAVQACLDRVNNGSLAGDPQPLCLGSQTSAAIVAPTDTMTARKLARADEKLRAVLARKCAGGELAQLSACGTDPTSAADCLTCTHWRQAFDAIRSSYGP
jgi:hypothetical protein